MAPKRVQFHGDALSSTQPAESIVCDSEPKPVVTQEPNKLNRLPDVSCA